MFTVCLFCCLGIASALAPLLAKRGKSSACETERKKDLEKERM